MGNMRISCNFSGPGWYGPLSRHDGDGDYVQFVRVHTDAHRDDPFRAGRDAYGRCGTPDWFDTDPARQ